MAAVASSEHRAPLGLAQGGRDEEPGLPEVLGQWEPSGQRQMADHAAGHDALHRDVGGVGVVRPGRVVGEVPLENHLRTAGPQRIEEMIQLAPVGGEEGVATPLRRPRLENGRPTHLGLDGCELRLGLLGADHLAGGHGQPGIGQDPALSCLVGECGGRRRRVEGQAAGRGQLCAMPTMPASR